MIHWQVKFRSLRSDTLYTASIYDDNYGGSPVQLTGAANPFETQEDDSEDAFSPVRTQSGYLRIADNGYAADGVTTFNWRDFIPTTDIDRPIKLTHEEGGLEVIDWMGTIQAQNFGAGLFENTLVREYPLQCPLTVMSHSDVSTDNKKIRNFAYILWTCMNTIPALCRPVNFVIQGGLDAKEWLKKKVDWIDFIEQDRNFTAKSKYDYGTVFEYMCKYWGWTARTAGDTLYLVSADDTSEQYALKLTWEQLTDLAAGNDTGYLDAMFTTVTIGSIFSTADNMDYQDRGPNKVIVKVDPNKASDSVIDPFDAELVKEMNRSEWNEGYIENDGDDYWHYSKDVTDVERYDLIGEASNHPTHSPQWHGASFNILQKYNGVDAGGGYTDVGNVIHINRTYNGFAFMTLETVYEHCFSDGFFRMFATTYRKGEKYENGNFYAGNPAMKMKLGIGTTRETAKWWDGRAWQDNVCTFLATIGNKKPELFSRYEVTATSYEETSIIQTSNLFGRMFIDLLGTDDSRLLDINGQKEFDLLNFRVEYQKNDNVTKHQFPNSGWWYVRENIDVPTLEYEAKNESMVKSDYNIDCVYASNDGIQPGYGILMNENGSYMSTVEYNGEIERPEQHLANRVADYWATSKRRITCGLLTHDGTNPTAVNSITPCVKVVIDGTTLYPFSVSHIWVDDEIKIMALEIHN